MTSAGEVDGDAPAVELARRHTDDLLTVHLHGHREEDIVVANRPAELSEAARPVPIQRNSGVIEGGECLGDEGRVARRQGAIEAAMGGHGALLVRIHFATHAPSAELLPDLDALVASIR